MNPLIDLGDDHQARIVPFGGDPNSGIDYYHKTPEGKPCGGFITITGSAWAKEFSPGSIVTWELVSADPLTLSPSLLCECGDHGFIREGKWVPA
jgi:hypothetical protein